MTSNASMLLGHRAQVHLLTETSPCPWKPLLLLQRVVWGLAFWAFGHAAGRGGKATSFRYLLGNHLVPEDSIQFHRRGHLCLLPPPCHFPSSYTCKRYSDSKYVFSSQQVDELVSRQDGARTPSWTRRPSWWPRWQRSSARSTMPSGLCSHLSSVPGAVMATASTASPGAASCCQVARHRDPAQARPSARGSSAAAPASLGARMASRVLCELLLPQLWLQVRVAPPTTCAITLQHAAPTSAPPPPAHAQPCEPLDGCTVQGLGQGSPCATAWELCLSPSPRRTPWAAPKPSAPAQSPERPWPHAVRGRAWGTRFLMAWNQTTGQETCCHTGSAIWVGAQKGCWDPKAPGSLPHLAHFQ